jgi:two-component system, cell cycle sensor histidine kinase and response regulator CckA
MNLYVNSSEAISGNGDIFLETENIILNEKQSIPSLLKPGRYVKISVTDNGIGMDEKTRERIFEPFFTTKTMQRGTGLGLASVYGIVKGHGGMINVYSEPGHGTTFTIYLRASEKEVVKEKPLNRTVARGTETILLMDDEKMVLETGKELLESMGYTVYAVESPHEALALYEKETNKIDLVILDMIMPGISGGEIFNYLREINPGVKIILSSGYSLNGKAQAIMDRGCDGFLQKPFDMERLSGKIREILD